VAAYEKALGLEPGKAGSYNGLGNVLDNLGQAGPAMEMFARAIELEPDDATTHNNLGVACMGDGAFEQAAGCFRQSLSIKPDFAEAAFNAAILRLLRGDYKKGWPGYENRRLKSDWRHNYPFRYDRKPRWHGESFAGQTLFVHDEQGFGDAIQFVRYLDMARTLGGRVVFETRKPLLGLLAGVKGIDEITERSPDGRPRAEFDLWCPLMSLPGIFSTTERSIPATMPYLQADPDKKKAWRKRIAGKGFRVGLVWSGNPTHFRGRNRSCIPADLLPVLKVPGVRFYGLQKGAAAREAFELQKEGLITNLGDDLQDFSETAAAIANLDLVISIDTAVAHLAGAMGKPVWVLLAHVPDWRWLLERSDSPWYPTARLFRQTARGDWETVALQVATALAEEPGNR